MLKDLVNNLTEVKTPKGTIKTDNPWVERSIAGAIIVGTAAYATKIVCGSLGIKF